MQSRSLGAQVYSWCRQWLRQPDGPNAGGPWVFTGEQARFIEQWYAVDERGRWVYNRGVLRRCKGWGKSPFVAALALAELCGPVRFDGWAGGELLAAPVSAAWVQLAGVSEKQTMNTMSMVLAMVAESPIVDEYGLDTGLTRIFTATGGRLEPITASASTAEGARPTFVVEDETHLWTESNNGTDLDRVNRRNLGKSRDGAARMLETTNAHAVGMGSVAEKSYDAWNAMLSGRARQGGLLYDAREAAGDIDLNDEAELMAGLTEARGDSLWLDLERIRDEVWDPSTPDADSRRFYLNQITSAVNAWITEPEWAGCADATKVIADNDMIVLGFDGSRKRARGVTDATALIGCRVSDGHLFEIGVWEQPDKDFEWQVPVTEVVAAVDFAFDSYNVVGFYADPAKWETYVAAWEAKYVKRLQVRATREHPVEWWMTGGRSVLIVRATAEFETAVVQGELTHDGSYRLTAHVLNARRHETARGIQIGKSNPDSPLKIDAAIAAVLAWQARLEAVAKGVTASATFAPRRIR